jgi:hypothetical protein
MLTSAAMLLGGGSVLRAAGAAAEVEAGVPRFGVNYVPRKRWWYCWLDWDQQAIEEDLNGIAGLGSNTYGSSACGRFSSRASAP